MHFVVVLHNVIYENKIIITGTNRRRRRRQYSR